MESRVHRDFLDEDSLDCVMVTADIDVKSFSEVTFELCHCGSSISYGVFCGGGDKDNTLGRITDFITKMERIKQYCNVALDEAGELYDAISEHDEDTDDEYAA